MVLEGLATNPLEAMNLRTATDSTQLDKKFLKHYCFYMFYDLVKIYFLIFWEAVK